MEHTVDEIREIIGSDSEMAKKINSMPYNLQLEDLMGFFLRVNYSKINTPARLSVYEDWNFKDSYSAPAVFGVVLYPLFLPKVKQNEI
jgi:hypothetical protein